MPITEISTVGMPHEEWLLRRMGSIGGSDASAVVGLNPYMSAYTLWAMKRGLVPPPEENEAMRLGHDLEQYVAERFTERTGKRVRRRNAIIYNSAYPFAHANIDRAIVGEPAGLECKTTSALSLKRFRGGEYPATYYVQCQHYMMVTGLRKFYLAVLILGKDFLVFEIDRDEDEIAALADAERRFWAGVETETPPPIDGSQSTADALNAIYPESDSDAERVDLTPCLDAIYDAEKARADREEADRRLKAAQAVIKQYMGDAEIGTADAVSVLWRSQTRRSFDADAFAKAHPEIDLAPFFKVTSSRIFKIKS